MKLLLFLSIIAACHSVRNKPVPLTGDATASVDSTIVVKTGDEFTISLRSSLGSGFSWMLKDSLDKSSLQLTKSWFGTDKQETAAKPDLQHFTFKAIKPGNDVIRFIYKRPWKKEPEAGNESKTYTIKISPL
jgi:predicted secreted protein